MLSQIKLRKVNLRRKKMIRAEIIANQSVQEEIIDALEENVENIMYTLIPVVYGRGGDDKKLGNSVWPETNFMLISYLEDNQVEIIKQVMSGIKSRFKSEGIKLFFSPALDC